MSAVPGARVVGFSLDFRTGNAGEIAVAVFNHLGERHIELVDELLAV
jgi:hypothetical protein